MKIDTKTPIEICKYVRLDIAKTTQIKVPVKVYSPTWWAVETKMVSMGIIPAKTEILVGLR